MVVAVVVLVAGADRETAATCVGVAVLCYLAAAALDRPWIAWAGVLGGTVLVLVGEVTGVGRRVVLGAAGAVLVAIALVVGAPRRPVLAQTIAFAACGGGALTALAINPRAGVVLGGLALPAHRMGRGALPPRHRRAPVLGRGLRRPGRPARARDRRPRPHRLILTRDRLVAATGTCDHVATVR
jgi:hypothetical protein